MAAVASSRKILVPRFMARFACIGSACEETCCSGWDVAVDEPHYRRLKKLIPVEGLLRRTSGVAAASPPRKGDPFATTVRGEDGACAFHEEGLCNIQRRFGEELLPDTCAIYPRALSLVGERIEGTIRLSCPEAARQLLLHEGAMELVEVDATSLGRLRVQKALHDDGMPYARSLDEVRARMLTMLSTREVPTAARLGYLLTLADESAAWLHADAKRVDDRTFAAWLDRFDDGRALRAFDRELARTRIPLEPSAQVLVRLLSARLAVESGSFGAQVTKVLATYRTNGEPSIDELLRGHRERTARAMRLAGATIERGVEHYVLSYVYGDWFVTANDLLRYATKLLLRVALIRFLTFGHPLVAALSDESSPEDAASALETAVVEAVSRMSRAIEHVPAFLSALDRGLPIEVPTAAHAMCLLAL